MKAAVVEAQNRIRIADVPRPRAGDGELVVRVRASGICATDVKILGGIGAAGRATGDSGSRSCRYDFRTRARRGSGGPA